MKHKLYFDKKKKTSDLPAVGIVNRGKVDLRHIGQGRGGTTVRRVGSSPKSSEILVVLPSEEMGWIGPRTSPTLGIVKVKETPKEGSPDRQPEKSRLQTSPRGGWG